VQLLREALPLVDEALQPERAGLLHEQLARCLRTLSNPDALVEQQEAVRLVRPEPSLKRARVLGSLAMLMVLVSRFEEAKREAEEAVAIAEQVGARAEEATARTALGGALIPLGDADAGLAELAAAIRLDAQANEVVDLLRAVVNHSDGLLAAGRPEDAVVAALDGLQQARRLGLTRAFGPDLACNATEALFALGRWDQAERVSREGLEASPIGAAEVSLPMARAALELGMGDLDSAEARLREVWRRSSDSARPPRAASRSWPPGMPPGSPSGPGNRARPTRRRGRRRSRPGSASASPTGSPTPASAKPRRSWPAPATATQQPRRCATPPASPAASTPGSRPPRPPTATAWTDAAASAGAGGPRGSVRRGRVRAGGRAPRRRCRGSR
jgi:tetratricopeptide (TPR) repeat protein